MTTAPVALPGGWRYLAACKGAEAELFFAPGPDEGRPLRLAREAKAKRICAECPVKAECLEAALAARESFGVWGGLNEYERRRLLSRRAG
jgi:WhiB family redox-sensing transcriptional regulator